MSTSVCVPSIQQLIKLDPQVLKAMYTYTKWSNPGPTQPDHLVMALQLELSKFIRLILD